MWQNRVAPGCWERLPLSQQHRQCPTSMSLTLLECRKMEEKCQPQMCAAIDAHLGVAVLPRQWDLLGRSQALIIQLGLFPDSPFLQPVGFFLSILYNNNFYNSRKAWYYKCKIP